MAARLLLRVLVGGGAREWMVGGVALWCVHATEATRHLGRNTFEHVAERAGALRVVVLQPHDLEPGVEHELVDRAVEVTAAGEPSLDRGQPVLPVSHAAGGRAAVLDEVKRCRPGAARGGSRSGRDRRRGCCTASRSSARGRCCRTPATGSGRRGRRTRTGTPLRATRLAASLRPTVAGSTARTSVTAGWVVGDVQTRAEADLEHLAVKRSGDAGADRLEFATAHDQVDEARNDLAAVQAHTPVSRSSPLRSRPRLGARPAVSRGA